MEEDPIAMNKRLKEQQMKDDMMGPDDAPTSGPQKAKQEEVHTHSTGFANEGGSFDAAEPGAVDDANRLREEIKEHPELHHVDPHKAAAAAAPQHHGFGGKIHHSSDGADSTEKHEHHHFGFHSHKHDDK